MELIMFNNPLSNHLNRFFNRNNTSGAAGAQNDLASKLASKHGKTKDAKATDETQKTDQAAAAENEAANSSKKNRRPNYADAYEKSKSGDSDKAQASSEDTVELTPMEQRKKRLEEIMAKVEEDYAAKYPGLAKKEAEAKAAAAAKTETSEIVTSDDPSTLKDLQEKDGIKGFINDMPLFNEFKTSLMDAFKRMDSATSGSISAQYELNYTSMQYIANEAGGYEYKETSLNIKLDLNYVKAAGGGKSGADIAKALEEADDFESFAAVLQELSAKQGAVGGEAAAGTTAADSASKDDPFAQYKNADGKPMTAKQLMNQMFKNVGADGVMQGMQDYFGPEATSGRIIDFATAFFPASSEFKEGGDTEEARQKFADRMGKAIQKGFDQAIGKIGGNFNGAVKDGVDKTHELVFKGLEDFVKNGVKPEEEEKQSALQEFAFSFEMNYSQKTTSVSYGSSKTQESSNINTQA